MARAGGGVLVEVVGVWASWRRNALLALAFIVRLVARIVFFAYVLASRLALYAITGWFVVYFTANAPAFHRWIWRVVDGAIPGRIEARSVQWGPVPWRVRVVDARITHPDGTEVIRAGRVYAEVDLADLARWLAGALTGTGPSDFRLHITRTVVEDFRVDLDFHSPLGVRLAEAFTTTEPSPPGDPPSKVRVDIGGVYLRDGRCRLHFEAGDFDVDGIRADGGSVLVRGSDVTVEVATTRLRRAEATRWAWLGALHRTRVEARSARVDAFRYRGDRIDARLVTAAFDGLQVRAGGWLRFPSDAPLDWDAWLSAAIRPASSPVARIVQDLLDGAVVLDAHTTGPAPRLVVSARAEMQHGRVSNLEVSNLIAHGAVARRGEAWRLERGGASFDAAGGHTSIDLDPVALGQRRLAGAVDVGDVDLARALAPFLDTPPAWLRGRVSAHASLTLDGSREALQLDIDVRDKPLRWEAPAGALAPRRLTVRARGKVRVVHASPTTTLDVEDIDVDVPGAHVHVATGHLDTETLHVRARVRANIDSLHEAVAPWRVRGLAGELRTREARVEGPLDALRVHPVSVHLSNLRVAHLSLGDASLRVALEHRRLTLDDIDWTAPFGHVEARATLALEARRGYPAHIHVTRARDLWLRQLDARFRGTAAVFGVQARLRLADPLRTLNARGRVELRGLKVPGLELPWRRVTAQFATERGSVHVSDLRAASAFGDVLHVDSARVRLRPLAVQGEGVIERLAWDTVAGVARLPGGRGELRGRLRFRVDHTALDLDGTLSTAGLQIGNVRIGEGKLVLVQPDGTHGVTRVRSEGLVGGAAILPDSSLRWGAWGALQRAELRVALDHFAPHALLGEASLPKWLHVAVTGSARASLDARGRLRASAHVPKAGLRVEIASGYQSLRFTNAAAFDVAFSPENGLTAGLADLRSEEGHRVVVCGQLAPERRLDAAILLDFPLWFGGLERGSFSRLEGRVYTLRTPGSALPSCAAAAGQSTKDRSIAGFVRVAGSLRAPVVAGRVVLDALEDAERGEEGRTATLKLRDMPDAIEVRVPATVELAALGPQAVVVRIPKERAWTGRFGDGRFTLWGRIDVARGEVTRADARVSVSDVPYALGKDLRVRTSGELHLEASAERRPGAPPLVLTGALNVVEGVYAPPSRPRALLLFGGAGYRRVEVKHTAANPSPVLEAIGLDVRVRSANVAVRAALPFAETELTLQLDLRIRGTAAAPKVFGHVEILPGGTIRRTLIGRDFEVDRAGIDFDGDPNRPHVAASVSTELTFRRQATTSFVGASRALSSLSGPVSEEEAIRVTLSFEGEAHFDQPGHEFDDIEVRVSSDAGYQPAELMTALLTGAPPGAGSGSDPGVTVSLLADDLARALASSLFGALIKEVSFDIGPQGFGWQLGTRFGRAFHLRLEGTQTSAGQTVQPRFEFRITERLSLEGALRLQQFQEDAPTQTYEAKLRYRIPIQ